MKLSDDFGQEIEFSLPDDAKKIGVNCSGGADSSIMLYMICDYLKSNERTDTMVSVVSCANDYKHRWNVRKAADVINYVIEKLNFNQIDVHYSYYRDFQKLNIFMNLKEIYLLIKELI